MRTMQAIVLREIGGPQNLHVEELEAPVAGPGEILVKVDHAAFNRRDVYITQGLYPGIVFPVIPGSDGCGFVAAHGPGAHGPAVGASVVINPMLGWGDNPAFWRSDSSLPQGSRPIIRSRSSVMCMRWRCGKSSGSAPVKGPEKL